MAIRFLFLSSLLVFLALGGSGAYGADSTQTDNQTPPPPPIPDSSDITAPPAPPPPSDAVSTAAPASSTITAPPVPEPPASIQPPPPPVPPEVSNSSSSTPVPSTVPPPPLPDSSSSVQPPAPPPPPEVSNVTPVPTPSTTVSTPPTPPEAQAPPAATPVPPAPTPVVDAYAQALSLFKEKQYREAIPFFKEALSQKPGDYKLYYYLGSAQYKAGRPREAVVNLTISYNLRVDLKLEDFVRRLRATLTSQEILWADAQVAAYGTGKTADVPAPIEYPQFGLRLQPEVSLINLSQFTAASQAYTFYANSIQGTDPGYSFSGTVPNSLFGGIVEPVLRMDSHLEFGIPLSYLPVGTVSGKIQDPQNGNSTISFDISALLGGLDVILLTGDRPFQFFASIGPRLASVQVGINYTGASQTANGTLNSTVFGGETQVGVEWEIADNFFLTPSIGYRWLQAGPLTGNVNIGGVTNRYRMEFDPGSTNGSLVAYVPSNEPDPAGMSPFNLDLSGPTSSLTLSALF